MPKLLISLPSGDISKELSGEVITIGRTPDNKVQIDHHSVSAHHARLILSNGNYKIKDLDSTNRSCVNGIPVSDAELTESCFLRFGTIDCVYKTESSSSKEQLSKDQLSSQLSELQRQMENLMKARDLIHQQNQGLIKERDEAKLAAETSHEQFVEAKKQIEQLSAASAGNQQQVQEVSGQTGPMPKTNRGPHQGTRCAFGIQSRNSKPEVNPHRTVEGIAAKTGTGRAQPSAPRRAKHQAAGRRRRA